MRGLPAQFWVRSPTSSEHPHLPAWLILLLGGFLVLTVGGVGIRGITALFGGDAVSGLKDLADFGLQVPTVALAIAIGVIATERWVRAPGSREI